MKQSNNIKTSNIKIPQILQNIKIPTKLKDFFTEENREIVIGILTILLVLWLILYAIPGMFVSLFDTFLGNIILLMIILLVSFKDYTYAIGLAIIILIIYRFVHISNNNLYKVINTLKQEQSKKEGFELSQSSIDDFLLIQNTFNPNNIFDPKKLQDQVSQEEMDYFLKNGEWPWSEEVIELYKAAISANTYIRTSPEDAVNQARQIYNQSAILQIISWQTKEGQFLINGVIVDDGKENPNETLPSGWGDYGYSSGLITPMHDIIKCNIDPKGKDSKLERIHSTGKDLIYGVQTKEVTNVNYDDLPKIIKGFNFINGVCNPCAAVNSPPEYNCPFKLEIPEKNKNVSSVWKYLWNI